MSLSDRLTILYAEPTHLVWIHQIPNPKFKNSKFNFFSFICFKISQIFMGYHESDLPWMGLIFYDYPGFQSVMIHVELVSKELNHFRVIAGLFRQIGGHSSRFVLFCSFWRLFTIKMIKSVKVFPFSFWKIITKILFFFTS